MFDLQRKVDLGLTPAKQIEILHRLDWSLEKYHRIVRREHRGYRNPSAASRADRARELRRKYIINLYEASRIPSQVWDEVIGRGVCEDCGATNVEFRVDFRIAPHLWGNRRLRNLKCVCRECYVGPYGEQLKGVDLELIEAFFQLVRNVPRRS